LIKLASGKLGRYQIGGKMMKRQTFINYKGLPESDISSHITVSIHENLNLTSENLYYSFVQLDFEFYGTLSFSSLTVITSYYLIFTSTKRILVKNLNSYSVSLSRDKCNLKGLLVISTRPSSERIWSLQCEAVSL
jgi:hypothetical protein